jgi:hypothetical protein
MEYVLEHFSTDCYCPALDLGNPQGRLVVYRGANVIHTGSDGNRNVTFGVTDVTRDNRQLTCVLDWITSDADDRKTDYSINVACEFSPLLQFHCVTK